MPVERNVRQTTKDKRKPDYLQPPRRLRRREGVEADLEVDDDNDSVASGVSASSARSAPGGWLGGFFGGAAATDVAPVAAPVDRGARPRREERQAHPEGQTKV